MKRKTLMVNIVLGALLVAGGVVAYLMVTGDKPATATSVRTVAVQQGTVTSTVTADGTVGSATSMSADFVTAGRVSAINVKLGDTVAAGTVLATVDATEPNAELATAKKNLTAAKEALSRADANGKSQAQNQVDQAKSAVDAAQRKVDGTVLKAPMAGTVVAINGAIGGQSSAGGQTGGQTGGQNATSFMQLADLTKLQVSASVPEADATRLKNDQAATVTWNALANTTATGKVTSISPTAAASGNVVSYPIVVALDTIPNGVKLGQSVKLTVTVDRVEDAIYVPNAAVRSTGNRALVTVVANGKQESRLVQIGLKGDSFTVITEGLSAGEQVVLATATTGGNTNQFPGGFFPGGGQGPGGGGGFRQGGGQGGNQGGGN
ncbi:MAG TPA: efflux RND transporter periplasmic adaptor subunit [Candidatus Limnocylindrales bacterium]|nr:efflux RND transporter periplasmic adaptor subunit [Candidatus Limnocylindrales bacterium]